MEIDLLKKNMKNKKRGKYDEMLLQLVADNCKCDITDVVEVLVTCCKHDKKGNVIIKRV
jgi:hypothetical protein